MVGFTIGTMKQARAAPLIGYLLGPLPNDDFEGGETEFLYQNVESALKREQARSLLSQFLLHGIEATRR